MQLFLITAAVLLGATTPVWSQELKTSTDPQKPSSFSVTLSPLASKKATSYSVALSPGDPSSKLAPRYSPPGRQLKLEAKNHSDLTGFDHLEARLTLGPNTKASEDHLLVLARSLKDKPYDLLFVDVDGTGKTSNPPIKTEPKVVRKNYWSSFDASVRVNHAKPGEIATAEDYPVAFWAVVEKETDTPPIIRVSRRGYLTGSTKIGDASVDVVLSDSNNDGVLSPGDWWELREKNSKSGNMRSVGDFAWAGGKAWMLELEATSGRKAKLVSFDPGVTEEEDLAKRDRLREDRMATRAANPIPFRMDVDAALKDVADKKTAYFIKFETDWCGPCKDMAAYVFTAKDVADAASGLTCIIVDGDERKDLTEKLEVRAYPTGILFDVEGKEIARYVGYQGVKETTAFFKKPSK